MGTWGIHTFDNDGTSDWLWELEETDDTSLLEQAFDLDATDYLESPDAENILAAAEIIHGIKHGPRDNLPDDAILWINEHKSLNVSALIPKAVVMIERVLAENSELRELWQENEEDFPQWQAEVIDLRDRLKR